MTVRAKVGARVRTPRERLAFALDYATLDEARQAAGELAPFVGVLKVGLELFVRAGSAATGLARELGVDLFLDLKLHDIPETVERAVTAARSLGVRYLTVHAAGGPTMLTRAVAAARAEGPSPALEILAVTVLTSLDASDLDAIGVVADPRAQVLRLANMAWAAGVRGFVASAEEAGALRGAHPDAFIVTPGIRLGRVGEPGRPHPPGSPNPSGDLVGAAGDQKRVATPARAIADGADLLVVGRPIRDAADPPAAARAFLAEIEGVAGARAR